MTFCFLDVIICAVDPYVVCTAFTILMVVQLDQDIHEFADKKNNFVNENEAED